MPRSAAQLKMASTTAQPAEARIIDIRTRQPWRPPQPSAWLFLFDMAITFSLVLLGAWLFLKMRGG